VNQNQGTEPYDDTHNSKWLGIFFWHINQYLDQMDGSLVEAKVNIRVHIYQ
jgi:hypothetical protein